MHTPRHGPPGLGPLLLLATLTAATGCATDGLLSRPLPHAFEPRDPNAMIVRREILIDAPPGEVWRVVGEGYADCDVWASSVEKSTALDEVIPAAIRGAPAAGRTCQTSLGPFHERIVEYDPAGHAIAYTASGEKMPFFVKSMQSRWRLTPDGTDRTRATVELTVGLLPVFDVLMTLPMKAKLGGVMTEAVDDLKHYVETGTPHPRNGPAKVPAGA